MEPGWGPGAAAPPFPTHAAIATYHGNVLHTMAKCDISRPRPRKPKVRHITGIRTLYKLLKIQIFMFEKIFLGLMTFPGTLKPDGRDMSFFF